MTSVLWPGCKTIKSRHSTIEREKIKRRDSQRKQKAQGPNEDKKVQVEKNEEIEHNQQNKG